MTLTMKSRTSTRVRQAFFHSIRAMSTRLVNCTLMERFMVTESIRFTTDRSQQTLKRLRSNQGALPLLVLRLQESLLISRRIECFRLENTSSRSTSTRINSDSFLVIIIHSLIFTEVTPFKDKVVESFIKIKIFIFTFAQLFLTF